MINNRNVNIITDEEGNRIALIKDIRFRGKQNIDWRSVKAYLEGYMGDSYEISESAERVYIGKTLSDEFTGSEFTKSLKGANAKANAATAIPELIQIALNPKWQENKKEKIRRVTFFRSRGCCHPITPHSIPAIFGMRSARSGILYVLLRKPITTCPTKWLTDFPLLPNRKIPTSTANRNGTSIHQNPISKFSNKLK